MAAFCASGAHVPKSTLRSGSRNPPFSTGLTRISMGDLIEHARDELRGVVDHRHDAGIVEPGRADDAERADDAGVLVAIGRDDQRRARQREQLVLRADEDAHAGAFLGEAEKLDQAVLRLQILEQPAQQFDVGLRGDVFEQVGAAAHDEARRQAAFGAGPDGEALFDEVLRQRVERGLGLVLDAGDLDRGLGERAAANMRVEEVRGLVKLRDGDARRQVDDAVLDVAVLRHQHGQRLGRFELDELDVLQRAPRSWR